jgi:hypothetical protein
VTAEGKPSRHALPRTAWEGRWSPVKEKLLHGQMKDLGRTVGLWQSRCSRRTAPPCELLRLVQVRFEAQRLCFCEEIADGFEDGA